MSTAQRHDNRRAALAVLCVAVLMVNLDNTILNVALPTLVRRLQATTGQLQWIVDAYAIVFGGVLLVAGSVADRFGRRELFLAGLGVFGAGSLAASFAGSVSALIAWRALMGAGAAMTIPAGLSIINDMFRDPSERARAVGAWSGTVGLGIAIGPVAGGLLLSRFWWGSIFLVNVPVVTAGALGTLALVPSSKGVTNRRPDPAGALLSVFGLTLVLWAIIEGPERGWLSGEVLGTAATGIAVVCAFVAWERRSDHPMLPLGYFRSRRFSVAASALGLGVFALLGGLFVMTQFLQFSLGYSPLGAGLRVLPISAVLGMGAVASYRLVRLAGTKYTAAAGLALIVIGLAQVALTSVATSSYVSELPGMLLIGLGAGVLLPAGTDSVLGSVTHDDAGVGSATNSTAMQVGGALGVAVIGSVLSSKYQHSMRSVLAGRVVPAAASRAILGSIGGALAVAQKAGGLVGAELAQTARAGFASGDRSAMIVAAGVTGAGALLVLRSLPSRPDAGPNPPAGPFKRAAEG